MPRILTVLLRSATAGKTVQERWGPPRGTMIGSPLVRRREKIRSAIAKANQSTSTHPACIHHSKTSQGYHTKNQATHPNNFLKNQEFKSHKLNQSISTHPASRHLFIRKQVKAIIQEPRNSQPFEKRIRT